MTAAELLRRLAELLNPDQESGEAGAEAVAAHAETEAPDPVVETEWKPRAEEAAEDERAGEAGSSHVTDADDPGDSSLRGSPRDEGAGVNGLTGEPIEDLPEGSVWIPADGGYEHWSGPSTGGLPTIRRR